MTKISAGLLFYRISSGKPEVFLVHPGGPFWVRKDTASWSVPKGEINEDEDPLDAAKREFFEETGVSPDGEYIKLGTIKQTGGKIVEVWAVQGDIDASELKSNLFSLEWPPKSGKFAEFPEIDRGGWFDLKAAKEKILPSQVPLITNIENILNTK
jgi:predicted NUDIX family NTP pyrophosphohydrolase